MTTDSSVTMIHSVSTPFSYSCKKSPKDAEDQLEAISGAAHVMKKSHGTVFTVSTVSFLWTAVVQGRLFQTGQLCATLYRSVGLLSSCHYALLNVTFARAPGNIIDWVYKKV